jgi:hypothetical protein
MQSDQELHIQPSPRPRRSPPHPLPRVSSPAATQAGLRAVHGPTVAAVQAVEVAYVVVALDIAFALADGLRPNREGSRAPCMHT